MATVTNPSATMSVIQEVSASLQPEDALGNVVPVPNGDLVVWSSSDLTIITVTPDATGLNAAIVAVGKVGTVTVTAVLNDNTGKTLFQATGTVQVTVAGIASIVMSFGTPSAKP